MASPSGSLEKDGTDATPSTLVNEETEALDGYVLDPRLYPDNAARFKTTADGRVVLIPQPLDSPDDPLNWSRGRKWAMLAIITYIAALADYTGGTAIITVIPQAQSVAPRTPRHSPLTGAVSGT